MAEAWAIAADRSAVTAAAGSVDRALEADPQGRGRHMSEGLWRLVHAPLVVHYTIDPARRLVEVTDATLLMP